MHISKSLTIAAVAAVGVGSLAMGPANAAMIGGVDFPQGNASFADAVVSYTVGTGGVTAQFQDANQALGVPNYDGANGGFVSLGEGGSITLQFIDNLLTGSGTPDDDLWIFEIGQAVEATFVDISKDGTNWVPVGEVGGATRGVDLDSFNYGPNDQFAYIRLTDDSDDYHGAGMTAGADIDAVGAISTVRVSTVPEPGTFALFGGALIGFGLIRRKRAGEAARAEFKI